MRTFIIRARKGTTSWKKFKSQVGSNEHIEVVAHTIMNAFFYSNGFRDDVEVYVILEASTDFPHTIKLSSQEGLSLPGFHEDAILSVLEQALKNNTGLTKNETRPIAPGISLSGFGFEKLCQQLLETRPVYLLDRKGKKTSQQWKQTRILSLFSVITYPCPSPVSKGLKGMGYNYFH